MSKYNCGPGDPFDMLAEEAAEVIQAIMKYKRFGLLDSPENYEGTHPLDQIHREIGDFLAVLGMCVNESRLTPEYIETAVDDKIARLKEFFGYDFYAE